MHKPIEIQATPTLGVWRGRHYSSVNDRKCGKLKANTLKAQLFTVRASADMSVRTLWIHFAALPSLPLFTNCQLWKHKAKEASNLRLVKGLIPSICDPTAVQSGGFAALFDKLCEGLSNRTEIAAEMLKLAQAENVTDRLYNHSILAIDSFRIE